MSDAWTGAVGLWLIDGLDVWVFGGWLDLRYSSCLDLRCRCVAHGLTVGVGLWLITGMEEWDCDADG